jgi:hypothetical protein
MRRATRVKSWRSICASACALFALASATSASAASTYVGRAVDDPKTRIEFRKAGGEVRGFEVRGAKFRCPHSAAFRDRDALVFGPMPLSASGSFSGSFTSGGNQRGETEGRVVRGDASGTFRLEVGVSPGEVCSTGRVEWRARRI